MAKPEKNYVTIWADINERVAGKYETGASYLGGITNAFKRQEAGRAAFKEFLLECFFYTLIDKKSTEWHQLSREAAIQHELINRHHWLPSDISKLSSEELCIVFHDDLQTLTLPDHAYMACREDLNSLRLAQLLDPHA
ncbi:hypothetical protein [Vreelandella sp. H-I2]